MLHSIFKNIFTILCLFITLFLIFELLVTFVREKPTTTTKLEKELETSDLPSVVICLDFGFNNDTVIDYGYHVSLYWTGATSYEKFIGWNGDGSRNKSSNDILEEIFLFPDRQEVLLGAWFMTETSDDYQKPDVTFRRVMFPFGRCMFISPSYDMTLSRKNQTH